MRFILQWDVFTVHTVLRKLCTQETEEKLMIKLNIMTALLSHCVCVVLNVHCPSRFCPLAISALVNQYLSITCTHTHLAAVHTLDGYLPQGTSEQRVGQFCLYMCVWMRNVGFFGFLVPMWFINALLLYVMNQLGGSISIPTFCHQHWHFLNCM